MSPTVDKEYERIKIGDKNFLIIDNQLYEIIKELSIVNDKNIPEILKKQGGMKYEI